jgi:hypothetical protein
MCESGKEKLDAMAIGLNEYGRATDAMADSFLELC